MFIDAELSQLPIGDGRTAVRRIVNLAAALREEGARTAKIVLIDVSVGGFRAEIGDDDDTGEGAEVWLKLPEFETRRSRVVWRKGREIGCEFEYPLHAVELEQIVKPKPRRIPKGVFRRA